MKNLTRFIFLISFINLSLSMTGSFAFAQSASGNPSPDAPSTERKTTAPKKEKAKKDSKKAKSTKSQKIESATSAEPIEAESNSKRIESSQDVKAPKTMDDILVKPGSVPGETSSSQPQSAPRDTQLEPKIVEPKVLEPATSESGASQSGPTELQKPKTLDDILVKPPSESQKSGETKRTDETTSPSAPSTSATEQPAAPTEVPTRNSSFERSGKSFYGALEGGFPVFPIPAYGFQAGYYLSPKTLLTAEMTQGRLGWSFLNVKSTTAGLHARRFFGNSFYGKIGADYRRLDIGEPSIPGLGEVTPDTGRAESIALSFSFGNQWQWETVNFGIDWFGLMIPVAQLHQNVNREGFYGEDLNKLNAIWDVVAKFWSVQLVRVSIGMSF